MFDKAMKQAELVLENQQMLSNLLDRAFVNLGKVSEKFYDVHDQVLGLIRMLRAWLKRDYTDLSPRAIIALVAALIYFVNPFDVLFDWLPGIGLLDDIAIITYVIGVFNREIEKFMVWESENNRTRA
jgi:uncharacterized membrane protein YkvA (DUF1232 family)